MKQRCLNSNHKSFKAYGGRGITICPEWLDSFDSFFQDMGEKPKGYRLDRINVNGNYEPGNCRWVTASRSNKNRRNSIELQSDVDNVAFNQRNGTWRVTFDFKTKTQAETVARLINGSAYD